MRIATYTVTIVILLSSAAFAQTSSLPNPPDRLTQLQLEKTELETKELQLKNRLGPLNQPIASTALTLLIGGFLFSVLSDRRARRNARLEKAIEFVDEVAADLNAIFTPLFRYIRTGNYEDPNRKEPEIDKAVILTGLEDKIPKLFEKRLSVNIRTKAFLPRKSQHFGSRYVRLCQELGRVDDILRGLKASETPADYVDRVKGIKQTLSKEWEATDTPTGRKLKQPYKEMDDWIEMIWTRSTQLMATTLKELLR